MEIADIVMLYAQCMEFAVPVAVVFYLGDLVVSTMLRTAFGGTLTFRGTL